MIGKTVQNLANFTFFGEKESFMAPYNDLITSNLENMRFFFFFFSSSSFPFLSPFFFFASFIQFSHLPSKKQNRSFYKKVAEIPEGWKEEPRKDIEEGELEKELSLLHEVSFSPLFPLLLSPPLFSHPQFSPKPNQILI